MQFVAACAVAFLFAIALLETNVESSPSAGGWGGSSGTGWSSSPAGSFGGSSASGWGATLHKNHIPTATARKSEFDSMERMKREDGGRPEMKKFTAWISQQ